MKLTLLIPNFDHGREVREVVAALAPHGLPCLIVDDGSGPETREILDSLAREHGFVRVERRKRNGGRGAALKTGYRAAAARGFTHAIQLDADGQHCADDVPRFVASLSSALPGRT